MSSGLGRFNDRKTKQRYLQKKADEINAQEGYMDPNYYETFDNFNPTIVKKTKPLFDESTFVDKLPFEKAGPIEEPYGPLNIGLTQSNNIPSMTHRRFNEMEQFYKSQKNKTGEDSQSEVIKQQKENDKKMKAEIHRDHIAEMFAGNSNISGEVPKTEFKDNFGRK